MAHRLTQLVRICLFGALLAFGLVRGQVPCSELQKAETPGGNPASVDPGFDSSEVASIEPQSTSLLLCSSSEGSDQSCPPGCDRCACCPGVLVAVIAVVPVAPEAKPTIARLPLPYSVQASGVSARIFRPPRPTLT